LFWISKKYIYSSDHILLRELFTTAIRASSGTFCVSIMQIVVFVSYCASPIAPVQKLHEKNNKFWKMPI